MKKIHNFIDNQFSEKKLEKNVTYLTKPNPHNNKILCKYINSSKEDIELAFKSANNSLYEWQSFSFIQRSEIIKKLLKNLEKNITHLSKLVSLETGKNYDTSFQETHGALKLINFFISEAYRINSKVYQPSNNNKKVIGLRSPMGISVLIVPANTPIPNITWKIIPSMLCGNSSILKASEHAPMSTNFLMENFQNIGLPNGVINTLYGDKNVGKALVADKRADLISFTGSTRSGQEILKTSSENLTKTALELGGKNFFIILKDADIDKAIEKCLLSAFSNSGQRCSSASHIVCENKIYEQFKSKFMKKIKKIKIGIDNDCLVGPLISKKHTESILRKIKNYNNIDFKIIFGGRAPKKKELTKGNYILPTIIEGIKETNEFYDNELFAPIVCLSKFNSMKQLIKVINKSKYGLTCAIHTNNLKLMNLLIDNINCGGININGMTYGSEPHMPFGGTKKSGNGFREPGSEAIDIYSELKIVSWDYS